MSQKYKKFLAEKIQAKRQELWNWHCAKASEAPPPFYCSIDLRDSGFKIVPVDSNLFPAGFNNICPEDIRNAPAALKKQVEANAPGAKKVVLVPESNTTNTYY